MSKSGQLVRGNLKWLVTTFDALRVSSLSFRVFCFSFPRAQKDSGWWGMVGLAGLEPATPRLSSVCSNQLSYRPG